MALAVSKIKVIHVAKRSLCLTDEEYRDILRALGGVESSRDLTPDRFDAVMDYFASLGFETPARSAHRTKQQGKDYGHRAGMASPEQLALIETLWAEYTQGRGTETGLRHWLERTFKVSSPRFLTKSAAQKAITALKKMKTRVLASRNRPWRWSTRSRGPPPLNPRKHHFPKNPVGWPEMRETHPPAPWGHLTP